ncbi:MAG: metallophosphoesterase [Bacteroidales bacterium]
MQIIRLFFLLFVLLSSGLLIFAQQDMSIPNGCDYSPILKIGLIADPQYCDCDHGTTRYYRETLWKLPRAVDTLNKYQVDFVVTLGDLTDQFYESYDSIAPFYEKLDMPYYNVLGNHDFYGITNEQMADLTTRYRAPGYYYDFVYGDWRFLVLDGTELAAYSRYVHPELAEEGDSLWNSIQGQLNAKEWNGGIGRKQQQWIRNKIEEAATLQQHVILFCHFTLIPEDIQERLWNSPDIVSLLEEYPNVVAYINGHNHPGSYSLKNNIHYIGQIAMVETPDTNSFGILEIYPKHLKMKGYGKISDAVYEYQGFKKNNLQLFLTDSTINYSDHSGDFIGSISHDTSNYNNPVNYYLDNSFINNQYFKISGDSLILNSEDDLSQINDLRIKVVAIDCDADTFSKIFNVLFDTAVLKFNYLLSDTTISIYNQYVINTGSLIEDYSRNGLNVHLNFEDSTIADIFFSNDSLILKPLKVDKTRASVRFFDDFTGEVFIQDFNFSVYDPLNHSPYHLYSEQLNIQLNAVSIVHLDELFTDPDNDILNYQHYICDTSVVSALLSGNHLSLSGLKADTTTLKIIVDDSRGGSDSVSLTLRVNSVPFHPGNILKDYIIQLNDTLFLNLGNIFYDADNDTLTFKYLLSDTSVINIEIQDGSVNLTGIKPGNASLELIAEDSFGGKDTLMINTLVNSKPLRIKEFKEYVYQYNAGCVILALDSVFHDPDNDNLQYTLSTTLNYEMRGIATLHLCAESAGVYKILLEINDQKNGIIHDSLQIRFNEKPSAIYPSKSENSLKVFPNPSEGIIKIQYQSDSNKPLKISISNLHGEIVYLKNCIVVPGTNLFEINLGNHIVPGPYFIGLTANDEVFTGKLIIVAI